MDKTKLSKTYKLHTLYNLKYFPSMIYRMIFYVHSLRMFTHLWYHIYPGGTVGEIFRFYIYFLQKEASSEKYGLFLLNLIRTVDPFL